MTERKSKPFSLAARARSFGFAFKGIGHMFRTEHNAWIHAVAAVAAIAAGFYFELSVFEWCFVVLAIVLVFAAELMNTAIEFIVDLVSPDHNELAGKAKDAAAAAVLICAIGAAAIGLIIFGPKVLALL